ncbi:MAG: Rv3235 family protein [Trueperella sp.]|nr:Rv3235 family protein [Trueperella sp.]
MSALMAEKPVTAATPTRRKIASLPSRKAPDRYGKILGELGTVADSNSVKKPVAMPVTTPRRAYDRTAFASPPTPVAKLFLDPDIDRYAPPPEVAGKPEVFAAALVGRAIEVLLGTRPARQLQTWMTPPVFQALVRRASLGERVAGKSPARHCPRVLRARVCYPSPRVAEVALLVNDGVRTRAAAVRLEIRRERWHVIALDII